MKWADGTFDFLERGERKECLPPISIFAYEAIARAPRGTCVDVEYKDGRREVFLIGFRDDDSPVLVRVNMQDPLKTREYKFRTWKTAEKAILKVGNGSSPTAIVFNSGNR